MSVDIRKHQWYNDKLRVRFNDTTLTLSLLDISLPNNIRVEDGQHNEYSLVAFGDEWVVRDKSGRIDVVEEMTWLLSPRNRLQIKFKFLSRHVDASHADLGNVFVWSPEYEAVLSDDAQLLSPTVLQISGTNGDVLTFDFSNGTITANGRFIDNANIIYTIRTKLKKLKGQLTDLEQYLGDEKRYRYELALVRSIEDANKTKYVVPKIIFTRYSPTLNAFRNRWISQESRDELTACSNIIDSVLNKYKFHTSPAERKSLAVRHIANRDSSRGVVNKEKIALEFFTEESTRFLFEFHFPSIGVILNASEKMSLRPKIESYVRKIWNRDKIDLWFDLRTISNDKKMSLLLKNASTFDMHGFLQLLKETDKGCYHKVKDFILKTS